ncbi:MAG: hypothetical protein K5892_02280 [Acholeplasmatales bacterium]|nr:hypothetical protein [Acholeplasmatales bacterium]
MKKLALLSLFLVLLLFGCNNKSSSNDNEVSSTNEVKNDRYEIELTMDNYWKYFSNTVEEYTASQYTDIIYENTGILNFAYYEDVVFTLELSYEFYDQYGMTSTVPEKVTFENKELEMKANGEGKFVFSYTYYAPSGESNLYHYIRYLKLKHVRGKVLFSI